MEQDQREPGGPRPENENPPAGVPGLTWVRSFQGLRHTFDIAWSADGSFIAASGEDGGATVWSAADGIARNLEGYGTDQVVQRAVWHPSRPVLVTWSTDNKVRIWDAVSGTFENFCTTATEVSGFAWSPDGDWLAITEPGEVMIWDVGEKVPLPHLKTRNYVFNSCWTLDGQGLVVGSEDAEFSLLRVDNMQLIRKLPKNKDIVVDIALSPDGKYFAACQAKAVLVWDLATGHVAAILEDTASFDAVRFSPGCEILAALSASGRISFWRCHDWVRVAVLPYPKQPDAGGLAFHPFEPLLAVKEESSGQLHCYEIDYALLRDVTDGVGAQRYGNAKVVLLGDSGVGKSGLGLVLSGQPFRATDSTHGRNVWTFAAEVVQAGDGGTQTREVLLWDLAGQPGYRLVHQLHLNEVAVALIVFDSRGESDPFSGVKYWVRALAQARRLEGATAVPLTTYLVAARADRGGVVVSAERVRAMVESLGLAGFFETSAKQGWQVAELGAAIRDGIDWGSLPVISSSPLFDSIKQFLLEEKQRGRFLCTVDDLFHGFLRVHPDEADSGTLRASFETCVGRVESRGLIRRLRFGDLVLLQPELLDAYASGMVHAAKDEPDGLGFIAEEDALTGRFRLGGSERIADKAQEKLLLIATVEELLRHEIALKQVTDQGVDLVFPSQFTRERPDAPDIPGKEVTFAFEGPLHSIYATLAVRLSHSRLFRRQDMWQDAASYTATAGGGCGIHLRELEEGRGELVLFYDQQAGRVVRSQFETYVADHLRLRALPGTLTRRAILACPVCRYVLPEELVRRRLDRGAVTVRCPVCDETVIPLVEESPAPADDAVAEMNRSADKRRDSNAAALRLKGKIETNDYDVFLCHNSKDKEQVKAIGDRLKERGILPWLDSWEIQPGMRWQQELRKHIKSVRSAAIFIGPRGTGPWQELEVEALLSEIAKRNRPIIPVVLAGRQGNPRLPAFLNLLQLVDMRQSNPDPFEQLIWGITGERAPRL